MASTALQITIESSLTYEYNYPYKTDRITIHRGTEVIFSLEGYGKLKFEKEEILGRLMVSETFLKLDMDDRMGVIKYFIDNF